MSTALKVGVVLSSGGGQGVYAHTGFLMALEEMGVNICAISGCSAGAVVGGIYASGTDLRQWSKAIANVKPSSYWTPDSWLQIFRSIVVQKGRGYTGLSDTAAAVEFIRSNLAAQTFEACAIPFHCLAVNLTRGTKTLFNEGELAPRIMSSAAVPVFFRPVEVNAELYSDGAIIEMAPAEAICCKHKLDALIIHHTASYQSGPKGMKYALQQPWTQVEIIQRLLHRERPWYLSDKAVALHHCQCGCGAPIVVVEPELPEFTGSPSRDGPKIEAGALQQALKLLNKYKHVILPREQEQNAVVD